MGKLVLSGPQNISLDGVVQDPDGAEGFTAGGWFTRFGGADLEPWGELALQDALGAEAWLMGRRSYEFFGSRWRPRTNALAQRLDELPKFVVSSTLTEPEWNNTTVLDGDVVAAVELRQDVSGEIVVPASYRLSRTLLANDLVDELRVVVFPVVLGGGERLFGDTGGTKAAQLVDSRRVGTGLVLLTYRFGGAR